MTERFDDQILWQPPAAERTRLASFADSAGFANDWDRLRSFAIEKPAEFWPLLWDFLPLIGERGDRALVEAAHPLDVRFFPDAELNFAENLLRGDGDRIAIIALTEAGTRQQLSMAQLRDLVGQYAAALRREGVVPGDRVAGIVPNGIEALAGFLASAAIGAVWASCSPDFGASGIIDRLGQIEPKVLFAAASYQYGGKVFELADKVCDAAASMPSLERIVIFEFAGPAPLANDPRAVWLNDWLAPIGAPLSFHRAGFDHPLVVLFSSGTTGKPKCLIHRAGGLLLTHMKEQQLHCDIRPGDRLFYFTTCGWMMWNWQLSALASGATLVLFDGNPFHPSPMALFEIVAEEAVTHFGTSARFIDACLKAEITPKESCDLTRLRAVLSTGSPLLPAGFDWVYSAIGPAHLASISGGTDICACFVGGWPVLPVHRGEIQGPMLGLDVDIVGEDGAPILGEPGELVCRNAHPSMPLGFWNDPDGNRYKEAYFSRFENLWAQGDWAIRTTNGGFVILGRSDATLNPGGVRIGTAEIYRPLADIAAIAEAVAVGREIDGDVEVWLFVRLAEAEELSAEFQKSIRAKIRAGASPRHVPARILAVPSIPVTRSGKISEIAVRDAINGRPVRNTGALANPEALEFYYALAANPLAG